MQEGFSNYAERVADLKRDKRRDGDVFGLAVHTSGSGILRRAREKGHSPDKIALDYYDSATYSTHFVAGHEGLYQLTDVREHVKHIGYTKGVDGKLSGSQRRAWYHSGKWAESMPEFAARWRAAWPGKASPSSLHPGKYPNGDYVAIELIPAGLGYGRTFGESYRYSLAQHVAVALVALELAGACRWPDDFEHTGRLASHEDLGPHGRVGPAGNPRDGEGWDPGRHRAEPWIAWAMIQEWIRIGRRMGIDELAGLLEVLYEADADAVSD